MPGQQVVGLLLTYSQLQQLASNIIGEPVTEDMAFPLLYDEMHKYDYELYGVDYPNEKHSHILIGLYPMDPKYKLNMEKRERWRIVVTARESLIKHGVTDTDKCKFVCPFLILKAIFNAYNLSIKPQSVD
ncbi:hypothetical protein BDQ12DRAFT_748513 [Crucibulum laeve]|uniref:Uncharacterized protein n=1 Tax=Crucibulum laeve TaxID=68775 RepID=A0A5C3MAH6_9AGAR|nr:hypothetical protein BDQ12DRAFT_748513 [Crucibulum laeve]